MCAVVRLRALMARQAARLITNPPIVLFLPGLAWALGLFAVRGSALGDYITFQL
jgi:hypothetical protein